MAGKKYRITDKYLNLLEGKVVKVSFPGLACGYKMVKILEIEPKVQTPWGRGRIKVLPIEGKETRPIKLAFSQFEILEK